MALVCTECVRKYNIKVTYAAGIGALIPWEYQSFADWFEFADWLKKENKHYGPVVIIAWEYVPCR